MYVYIGILQSPCIYVNHGILVYVGVTEITCIFRVFMNSTAVPVGFASTFLGFKLVQILLETLE